MGAGGGRGRVEGILAVCVHLAKDARAVALGNVRLHGFCDAYGAVPGVDSRRKRTGTGAGDVGESVETIA